MEHKTRASGFASMDQHKQREIARKGGMAAHQKGTAHEFTAEEARHAGRKGGQQVSANRSHMIEIGRLGGRRSAERRRIRGVEQRVGEGGTSRQTVPEADMAAGEGGRREESEVPQQGMDSGDQMRQNGVEAEEVRHQGGSENEEVERG